MTKTFLMVCVIYGVALGSAEAQSLSDSLGTSWLKIAPSTRYAGMADSALAVPDAYDEADINPAGLGLIGGTNLSLSQNFYAQGISAQHLIFTQATTDGDGFSLGVNYINFGNITNISVTGNVPISTGSYSPVGLNIYAAYGFGLGDGLRAGLTGHFIYDDIQESFPDKTAAVDAGLFYHLPDRPFSFSAVLNNLGWNIDEATLPVQVQAGGAYQWMFGSEKTPNILTLSGQADLFLNDGNYAQLGFGTEFWYHDLIALRAGYQFSNIGDLTGLTGLSLGAGIKYWNWQLDYALITLGELGVANQISLSVMLGGDQKPTATPTPSPTPLLTPTFTPTAVITPVVTLVPPPAMTEVVTPVPTEQPTVAPTMTDTPNPYVTNNSLTMNADFKSTLPYDKDMQALDKLSEFLLAHPDLKITIDGYTDNKGSQVVNVPLSVARAGQVKNYLIQKGIPSQMILWAKGHGDSNPVADNTTDEGRLQNRRVVIQWVPADQAATVSDTSGTLAEDKLDDIPTESSHIKIDKVEKWWGDKFDAQSAYYHLIHVIVPTLVNRHQLILLGDHRQLFFDEARSQKMERRKYINMVSGYYTAVAKNLVRLGDMKEANYYLHLALVYQAYNLGALKIQSQVEQKTASN